MKKNNTAEKAALGAEKISKALKESTEKSLRDMINETISNLIVESEEDPENDSYDVQDVEPDETPEVSDVNADEEGGEEGTEGADLDSDEGTDLEGSEEGAESDDADEWSDLEQYKIGDDDYDFTGVDGDEILKVYNKLGDDDQIFVKKEDDGTYSVKDDETGAEFVIELNSDNLDADDTESDEEFDIEGDNDFDTEDGEEFGAEGDDEIEVDLNGENEGDDEIEIDLGDEDEEVDDELNEDLGYTDSYQKDVFDKKFNMKEPADSKTTNDWDNGAPKGGEKPWAGKGDSKPFEKNVNECGFQETEDENLEEAGIARRKGAQTTSANLTNDAHAEYMQKGSHNVHAGGKTGKTIDENVKKIVAKAKAIQAENKQYRESLEKIKKSLYEAAVLNVNLGKLVDILVNETTTRDEKKSILSRFNNVKTISEGKVLYDTIKHELNESKKSSTPIVEKQFVANSKALNEAVIYSNDNPSLDLMSRMDNLYKK